MTMVMTAADLEIGYHQAVCGPISVKVPAGQVVAVVGPNGCGKTTLVRTVLGLVEPLNGRLEVFGEAVDERSIDFRANVAYVLDDDAYFPSLTVAEHLELTARGHGVRNARDVVAQAVADWGIAEVANADPANLSSGQRRRLLLAAAWVRPYALLVLDEPEQRLDTAMRERLGERIRAAANEGSAVLLVSHDPHLARNADKVLALSAAPSKLVPVAKAEDFMGQ